VTRQRWRQLLAAVLIAAGMVLASVGAWWSPAAAGAAAASGSDQPWIAVVLAMLGGAALCAIGAASWPDPYTWRWRQRGRP
jgi:hypothetical protein